MAEEWQRSGRGVAEEWQRSGRGVAEEWQRRNEKVNITPKSPTSPGTNYQSTAQSNDSKANQAVN